MEDIKVKVRNYELELEYLNTALGVEKYSKAYLENPILHFNTTIYFKEDFREELTKTLEAFICQPQDTILFRGIENEIMKLIFYARIERNIFVEEELFIDKTGMYAIKSDPYFDIY